MKLLMRVCNICIVMGLLISCTSKNDTNQNRIPNDPGLVEVSALDFKFEAPDSIPSGWTTFRFKNKGTQEHFFYTYRLPDNKTYEEFLKEAMGPFGSVWNEYASGKIDRTEAENKMGAEIPGWFFTELTPSGGPALTEAGETAQTTVKMIPGTYVVECYVKAPDGSWHTELGMQQKLTVTKDSTGTVPPTADAELTLSNYRIATNGTLTTGQQTIAVHIKENPEGFMLHDINLFRLNDSTEVTQIVDWMDWMDLEQFRAPAPAYSLGGVEHLAAGMTGYITVDLQPGNYAWISEGYGSRGMVQTFTVQ